MREVEDALRAWYRSLCMLESAKRIMHAVRAAAAVGSADVRIGHLHATCMLSLP